MVNWLVLMTVEYWDDLKDVMLVVQWVDLKAV
jgi:hypothetical protein